MAGFPLLWNDLEPPAEDGCPISYSDLAKYLEGCSYHYLREFEPPLKFGPLTLLLRRVAHERDFWVFRTDDGIGRAWFVVASAGTDRPERWGLAQTSDLDESAAAFLERTIDEWLMSREIKH
jgi:hypothetical protein